jgi:hypothetical protein
MAVQKDWTSTQIPAQTVQVDAYHNIKVRDFQQNRHVIFLVNTYPNQASYDPANPKKNFMDSKSFSVFYDATETNTDFTDYFSNTVLQEAGNDTIGQCYKYLKEKQTIFDEPFTDV